MGLSERVLRNDDARMAEELPAAIEKELEQYEMLLRDPGKWRGPYTRPDGPEPHEMSLEDEAELMDDLMAQVPEMVRDEYEETLALVWKDAFDPLENSNGQDRVEKKREWERAFRGVRDRHTDDLLVLLTAVRMFRALRNVPDRFQTLREIKRLEHPRSELARMYLRKASELFLWGLDAPCIVYSAAAIEASLKEYARQHAIVDLDVADSAAKHIARLLRDPLKKHVHSLRLVRNQILHDAERVLMASDEQLLGDVSPFGVQAADALRVLIEVLDELWPWTE